MTTALELRHIRKSFGNTEVLRGLSATFNAGERVLLLGANGAGKSTLLRICAGLSRPDNGLVAEGERKLEAAWVGYSGHLPLLYGELTVFENLTLIGKLCGVSRNLSEYMNSWDLLDHANTRFSLLSKGLQARASLARAFLNSPRYLFLDEPTSSLDEKSVNRLKNALEQNSEKNKRAGVTILVTHDIARLKEIGTRVLVIRDGTFQADTGHDHSLVSPDAVIRDYLFFNR